MKPAEQLELQAILNAERSLRDARALMARGKRTLAKRIGLIQEARAILDAHLTLHASSQISLVDQLEVPNEPAEAQ